MLLKTGRSLPGLEGQSQSLPFVPQIEGGDCGVACLTMILRSHGTSIQSAELSDQIRPRGTAVTASRLRDAAIAHGLGCEGYRVPFGCIQNALLPAIAHWRGNHFVVLDSVSEGKVHVLDPAVGRLTVSDRAFVKGYQGILLVFRPPQKR